MEPDDAAERAQQRDLVRRGYDAISLAYRGDDGEAAPSSAEGVSRYPSILEKSATARVAARIRLRSLRRFTRTRASSTFTVTLSK